MNTATIYKVALGLALTLTASSCNDMLDTKPQGQITADKIDNNAVDGLLAAAYAGLEAHFYGNNEAFAGPSTNWIFDVRSDDALKGGGATSMEANIHLLEVSEITSDNVSLLNKWQNNFFGITRANTALRAIASATNVTNGPAILAELRTLRAWYYFDLVRIFKHIPYFTENDDVNTKTNTEYTREQILGFIAQELKDAIPALPEAKSPVGRITRTTAEAILAKVCAFEGDWEGVKTYASKVIESGEYALYDNFGDLSKIDHNNGSESIFALQCSTAADNAHINWSNLLNCTYSAGNLYGTGDDFFLASQNLVNAFRTNPQDGLPYLTSTTEPDVTEFYAGTLDPRLDFTVGRIGFPWRGHAYTKEWCRAYDVYGEYSNKKAWAAPEEASQAFPWGCSSLNFMFIRYADILLLKAEALIETASGANAEADAGLREARTLINQVRDRARRSINGSYTPRDLDPSKADYYVGLYPDDQAGDQAWTRTRARAALRYERRLELAMEGNRWFDLVRWGQETLLKTMNDYMADEARVHNYYEGSQVTADEILFPTPLTEVDNSNGLYK